MFWNENLNQIPQEYFTDTSYNDNWKIEEQIFFL